jgi:hypothetical protein
MQNERLTSAQSASAARVIGSGANTVTFTKTNGVLKLATKTNGVLKLATKTRPANP